VPLGCESHRNVDPGCHAPGQPADQVAAFQIGLHVVGWVDDHVHHRFAAGWSGTGLPIAAVPGGRDPRRGAQHPRWCRQTSRPAAASRVEVLTVRVGEAQHGHVG